MIPAEKYLDAVNELRLLVFCECQESLCTDDGKQHFHQVILDPAQFKAVSDAVLSPNPCREEDDEPEKEIRRGFEIVNIQFSERTLPITPFEGMASHT